MKDGDVLKENVEITAKWQGDHYQLSIDALEIFGVSYSDIGAYFCRIENNNVTTNSSKVYLQVVSKFFSHCFIISVTPGPRLFHFIMLSPFSLMFQ